MCPPGRKWHGRGTGIWRLRVSARVDAAQNRGRETVLTACPVTTAPAEAVPAADGVASRNTFGSLRSRRSAAPNQCQRTGVVAWAGPGLLGRMPPLLSWFQRLASSAQSPPSIWPPWPGASPASGLLGPGPLPASGLLGPGPPPASRLLGPGPPPASGQQAQSISIITECSVGPCCCLCTYMVCLKYFTPFKQCIKNSALKAPKQTTEIRCLGPEREVGRWWRWCGVS